MISQLATLKSGFTGELLVPGDPGYDAARTVFNRTIDRRPALIARCRAASDVVAAVNFGRDHDLRVAVRCSGHNVAGSAVCDNGLVIDLSPMKGIQVNAASRTVRADAGLTWGEINDALQPHELAATGGFVSVTGVAGLTLGGGLGWLVRKHGLAIDNLRSAEVVLADGRLVTASAHENDDLFWAIRGGGGNFGVVTSFEFRVHPAGIVLAGIVLHPADAAAGALRRWRDLEADSPDELTIGALMFHFPDDTSGPLPLRGRALLGIGGVYAGSIEEGERTLQPLREYGPPIADLFQPTAYNVAQRQADFLWPSGLHGYWKSSYLATLSDEATEIVADFFSRVPSKHTVVVVEHLGGAMARVPDSATAFGDRSAAFNFLVTSAWADPADAERNITWTRAFFDAMRPFAAGAVYVNYLGGEEGRERVASAYGAAKYERLRMLKAKYDPRNLFRMNQNIEPALSAA